MNSRRSLLLLAVVVATGCDPGRLENPDRFKACMKNVELDIFKAKCGTTSCHEGATPQGALDLVAPGVGMRLKTGVSSCSAKPLISYTAEKLTDAPTCGSSMPLGQPLDAEEQKCVREYLAALADGGS